MRKFLPLLGFVVGLVACGGSDTGPIPTQGTDGAADATNDSGPTSDGAISADGATNDAGLPCPGASILHPGDNETRAAGSNVPFVGNARDATCKAIPEANLVWKESLGAQIGTGNSFGYVFNTKGTRTVTLTATDGASAYTATIVLNIN